MVDNLSSRIFASWRSSSLGMGSLYCSLVRIVRYTSQASYLVQALARCSLNLIIDWIILELIVVAYSFDIVYTFGSKRSCSSPSILTPLLRIEEIQRLLFRSSSRDRDSTLLDLYLGPNVSKLLLF